MMIHSPNSGAKRSGTPCLIHQSLTHLALHHSASVIQTNDTLFRSRTRHKLRITKRIRNIFLHLLPTPSFPIFPCVFFSFFSSFLVSSMRIFFSFAQITQNSNPCCLLSFSVFTFTLHQCAQGRDHHSCFAQCNFRYIGHTASLTASAVGDRSLMWAYHITGTPGCITLQYSALHTAHRVGKLILEDCLIAHDSCRRTPLQQKLREGTRAVPGPRRCSLLTEGIPDNVA